MIKLYQIRNVKNLTYKHRVSQCYRIVYEYNNFFYTDKGKINPGTGRYSSLRYIEAQLSKPMGLINIIYE